MTRLFYLHNLIYAYFQLQIPYHTSSNRKSQQKAIELWDEIITFCQTQGIKYSQDFKEDLLFIDVNHRNLVLLLYGDWFDKDHKFEKRYKTSVDLLVEAYEYRQA